MKVSLTSLLLGCTLIACAPPATAPHPGNSSTAIKAALGGQVEVEGARLNIPAQALSQDATITVSVKAAADDKRNPLQAVGPSVSVDLGGAVLKMPASLELPTTLGPGGGSLVILEADPNPAEGEPGLRVHAARAATVTAGTSVFYEVTRPSTYTAAIVPQPKAIEGVSGVSLEVPFYWQAGLPWCVPTSLAMTINSFQPLPTLASNPKFPGGFASNYGLASLIRQPANEGASVVAILNAASIPADGYTLLGWDAELVASATGTNGAYGAFQSYVVLTTTGILGLFPPKPVWTSSDRQWHAFVLTGLTNADINGTYINDANARWVGTHPSDSWSGFAKLNCSLKDKNDPGKGCAEAGDSNPDLYTLVLHAEPKPETERRGSIELSHGATVYFSGVGYPFPASVAFRNPSGNVISNWNWEGKFPNGYYFSDEAITDKRFPFNSNLTQDQEFKSLIPRSSVLDLAFNVVNTTNTPREYQIEARLFIGGSSVAQQLKTFNGAAYDRAPVALSFGNLGTLAPINGPTAARVEINLSQNGVVQDVKHIAFRLGPDPVQLPTVRVLVPSQGATLLKAEPFTFKGEGFDPHRLPDGRAMLTWYEGGTKLVDGPDFATIYSTAGAHTLTLVARGEYGAQATTSVSFTVFSPTRVPGEVVIVSPINNAKYGDLYSFTTEVALVGYATYSNGVAVPGDKLVWSIDGYPGELGRGASLTAKLAGGPGSELRHVVRLTALTAGGPAFGTAAVTVAVLGPVH